MVRPVLRSFGVDMSQWEDGIKNLLYHGGGSHLPAHVGSINVKREPNGRYSSWKRERSVSPRRSYDRTSTRPRSPPGRRPAPPVYFVNVRRMHQCIMHAAGEGDTVLATAKALKVNLATPLNGDDNTFDPKVWCAGRESRYVSDTGTRSTYLTCSTGF